jgi:hypothetical protein
VGFSVTRACLDNDNGILYLFFQQIVNPGSFQVYLVPPRQRHIAMNKLFRHFFPQITGKETFDNKKPQKPGRILHEDVISFNTFFVSKEITR